ncbi:MAG: DUF4377 domain-containing protein [Christiangramia sp.]
MYFKFQIIACIGFLALFSSFSCSLSGNDEDGNTEIVEMTINHFQQTAFGSFPQMVYLVQENDKIGGDQWDYLYDQIAGFEYEAGYVYNLSVKKEAVENPPQDASSIKYTLQNVSSKERVPEDESFDIKLKWGGHNFVSNSTGDFKLLNTYDIDCSNFCDSLTEDLEDKEEVTGTFLHGSGTTLKLIAIQ